MRLSVELARVRRRLPAERQACHLLPDAPVLARFVAAAPPPPGAPVAGLTAEWEETGTVRVCAVEKAVGGQRRCMPAFDPCPLTNTSNLSPSPFLPSAGAQRESDSAGDLALRLLARPRRIGGLSRPNRERRRQSRPPTACAASSRWGRSAGTRRIAAPGNRPRPELVERQPCGVARRHIDERGLEGVVGVEREVRFGRPAREGAIDCPGNESLTEGRPSGKGMPTLPGSRPAQGGTRRDFMATAVSAGSNRRVTHARRSLATASPYPRAILAAHPYSGY